MSYLINHYSKADTPVLPQSLKKTFIQKRDILLIGNTPLLHKDRKNNCSLFLINYFTIKNKYFPFRKKIYLPVPDNAYLYIVLTI